MRRILVAFALIAGGLSLATPSASAACANAQGGSAGPLDRAGVTFDSGGETFTVSAENYGNFASGPIALCSDLTVETATSAGSVTITNDTTGESCTAPGNRTNEDGSSSDRAITSDPFGFGATVGGDTGTGCAAFFSFDGITALPGAPVVTVDSHGADAGAAKDAAVKPEGTITLGGVEIAIPDGTRGYFTKGVAARSEHS